MPANGRWDLIRRLKVKRLSSVRGQNRQQQPDTFVTEMYTKNVTSWSSGDDAVSFGI